MSYKRWLIVTAILFGIGLIWGLTIPVGNAGPLSEDIIALEELADFLAPLPQVAVFIFIFLKNVSVVLISLVLSPLFCLVPVLTLVINGGVIGLVSSLILEVEPLSYLMAGLLPHGILEIPAFFMGEAVALSFGGSIILALFNKEKRSLVLPNLKKNLKYLLISLALFLLAAIIETYITPLLLN